MKEIKEINNKKIIIDTNILINCGRAEFGKQFKNILRTLSDNKNNLAVSIVSGFEIIKKYRKEKKVADYYTRLLNYIQNIQLDWRIMNIAGVMANELYIPKQKENSKKDNDFIIGGTVIRHNSLILTCDKDFARPFWNIVARECIIWEDEGCCKIENIFLLEFNHKEWEKKYKCKFDTLINKD